MRNRILWWAHNLLAHPLLVLWPALGERLHALTLPTPEPPDPEGAAPVHQLRSLEPEPVAAVVEVLREALVLAERGELVSVAICAETLQRCDATVYTLGAGTVAPLVLACRRLERRLLDMGESL